MRTLSTAVLLVLCLSLPARGQGPGENGEKVGLQEGERPSPEVRRDAANRRVSFEAVLVQDSAPIEAFLCGPEGRTHESLFAATALPEKIQEALLALGVAPASQWAASEEDLFALRGEKVLVRIEFAGGKIFLAEDLVWNEFEHRPMRREGWAFHGKLFEGKLPDEPEFSVTFQGLRGAALSLLDSPFAYRPYADAPLACRKDVLPAVQVDGERRYPKATIVLEPANEETIAKLALEQEGAPAAENPEAFLALARRIDAAKARISTELRPEVRAWLERGAALEGHEDAEGKKLLEEAGARHGLARARLAACEREVEETYLELDLLHEARELAGVRAQANPDPRVIEYKEWVARYTEFLKERAHLLGLAAAADVRSRELALAGETGPRARREDLSRDALLARVRALEVRPDLEEARTRLARVREMLSSADLSPDRRKFYEEEVTHWTRWVEYHEARIQVAESEARSAELSGEALDASEERKAEIDREIAGLSAAAGKAACVVDLFDRERALEKLRRDLRFYSLPDVSDEEKIAALRKEIEAAEKEIAELKARIEEDR